jgi:hypothetical protein
MEAKKNLGKNNVLLSRPEIGKASKSTHNLPEENFIFGKPCGKIDPTGSNAKQGNPSQP